MQTQRPLPIALLAAPLTAALLAGATAAQEEKKPAVPAAKIVAAPAQRQAPTQDELIAKRAEKLAKPVFQNAAWVLDYDAARAQAKKENKLILCYFTRSYAG